MAENNLIIEERKEFIVNPTEIESQFYRTAHFLTPSLTSSISAPPPPPPPQQNSGVYRRCTDLPIQISYVGWRYPPLGELHGTKWVSWVHSMCSLHSETWKKAGIFNAILSSIYFVYIKDELILGFSEKWCQNTNSFVFPWGEATVTLEDVMILGGYSVLGDSVLSSVPKGSEMEETLDKLYKAKCHISRTNKRPGLRKWLTEFMNSGSDIEHEAFLAYWLSRFVFPVKVISRDVLSIAVYLARGVKIALAPAVLASIYQSLSLLKSALVTTRQLVQNCGYNDGSVLEVIVSTSLALVQVWVFERFPSLSPLPHSIRENEPRIARWHNLKNVESEDILLASDSSFEWLPYIKDDVFTQKVHKDYEEFEVLVRFLRVSELVGLKPDCIEQYQPHRVAMQFGMDQDIPCNVASVNEDKDLAWSNYERPFIDSYLYVPSRFNESGVTQRYFDWWRTLGKGQIVNGAAESGKRPLLTYEKHSKKLVATPPLQRSSVEAWNSGTGKQHTEDNGNIHEPSESEIKNELNSIADHEQRSTTDEFWEGLEERVEILEKVLSLLRQGRLDNFLANRPDKPQA